MIIGYLDPWGVKRPVFLTSYEEYSLGFLKMSILQHTRTTEP